MLYHDQLRGHPAALRLAVLHLLCGSQEDFLRSYKGVHILAMATCAHTQLHEGQPYRMRWYQSDW